MSDLQEQLSRVEANLAGATSELAMLSAKVAGLRAHRDALLLLAEQQATAEVTRPDRNLRTLSKSDAIVEVLRSAGHALSIPEIVQALRAAGRTSETYGGVSVYLQNLLSQQRVHRPERGRYVPGDGQDG